MKAKRSQLEVIRDMLAAIQRKGGTIKPTVLMSKSNLSYKMMQEYLKILFERDLIVEESVKGRKVYTLADKGHEFLAEYQRLERFREAFGI
jgi:predicted transcriptional regulator